MRRLHDPAALVQGHRLLRAARLLAVPAWIFGLLAFVLFIGLELSGLDGCLPAYEAEVFGIVSMFALGLLWLLDQREPLVVRVSARDEKLPSDLHHVLALIDGLLEALERGDDAAFEFEATELGVVLERLRPNDRRYLEERGADPAGLRHSVCSADPDAKSGHRLSADRRRTLHHELVRFVAAARGRPCGDPYRSRIGNDGGVLSALRDPALARTRRRYFGLLLLLGIGWGVMWNSIAPLTGAAPLQLCSPWSHDPSCTMKNGVDLTAATIAFGLVPMLLLAAAAAARAAAWRSFAAALPTESASDVALDDPQGSPLPAMRRRRVRRRIAIWTLTGLVLSCGMVVVIHAYFWLRHPLAPEECAMIVGLVTLGSVVIPALVVKIDRQVQQLRGTTELFKLRRALAVAAPVRAELLEQLAETLAEAESLGGLPGADRDRVVARLRAASSRGPALSRAERDRLVLDVCACETLISAPAGSSA
jgi:hypothetical protein